MKRVLNWFLSLGLAIVMCFGVTVLSNSATAEYSVADAATDYYAPITATGGNELLGQVHDLITTTHKKYTSYADCKNPTYVKQTDPGSSNSYVKEFYSQADISSAWGSGAVGTWNREHVWCQSLSNGLWGESGGGADMHHIRPAESQVNSTRGNNRFGVATGGKSVYYQAKNALAGYCISNTVFEPLDNVKGDVARIVMYVYTHYNTYSNSIFAGYAKTNGNGSSSYFATLKFTNIMYASSESAAIELLLKWNALDPVDESERTRNDAVYSIQGNRNPFIDHPEYADAIWGNGTVTPGGGTETPDPSVELKSLSVSPATLNLYVGRSQTLTVTANPSNASNSVSWTSSNEAVATVSASGEVTAISVGTATITATSKTNPSIKATAQVSVEKSNLSSITINTNSFTLSNGYGFQHWTQGGISGIAYIYGANKTSMQFNKNKESYYLASTTAAPAPIKSVTVKIQSGDDRPWKLLTSNTPYGEVKGKPTNGNDQGTKTVTTSGVTWTVSGNDTYFALTYELDKTSGAAYLDSIIVEFGESGGTEKHECQHVCPTCSKCTDKNCKDTVCADKCQGHETVPEHECNHVCPTCSKCTDKNCKDTVCADKCQGHETVPEHECSHVCPTCSKCMDKNCKDPVCADKCQGHAVPEHECNHVCPTCSKCTDKNCKDPVCADKCQGHETVPEHECNHVCPTCGKCTDETCTDEVCADKCHGHGGNEEDTRLQEFHYAVSNIVTKGTLDERLASINKAIRAYQALTAEQKTLAADDVATLQQAISDYNKTVNSFNQDAQAANDAATGKSASRG